MTVKFTIYLAILIFAFSLFTYKSFKKIPCEYDMKLVRRIYYIFTIVHIYFFIVLFKSHIKDIKIVKTDNINTNLVNYLIIICFLFILSILWEYLFVSCRTFKNFKFKNMEISVDELSEVKYVDNLQEKEIDTLYSVLNAKIKMLKYIDYYINNKDLNPQKSYINILKEYKERRKGIEISIFNENAKGLKHMQKKLKLNHQQLSSIIYSMNLYGFCSPINFRNDNYIFARIRTKYLEDDIIIVLRSNFLIDKEYLVLIDIINYFEIKIDLEILKLTNESNNVEAV